MIESRWTKWSLLLAPAIIAMTLQLIATAGYGPGLAPDSAVYLNAAGQLAAGKGFTQRWPSTDGSEKAVPVTWYPPAYPLLLSIAPRLGLSQIGLARYTSAFFLGITTMLGCAFALRMTRSISATAFIGAILCSSTDQLEVFAYALSEPLFIVAVLIAHTMIAKVAASRPALDQPAEINRDRPVLFPFALAVACAVVAGMTRYIGVALAPIGAICILKMPPWRWSKRVLIACVFAFVACSANALWFIRNAHVAGTSTGRAISFHPVNMSHARGLLDTVSVWLFPGPLASRLAWLAAVVIVLVIVLIARAFRARPREPLAVVFAVFVPVYVLALAASITWIDAATPVDYRLLAPLFVPIIVLSAYAWRMLGRSHLRHLLLALAVIMLISNSIRTTRWVKRANGLGERLTYASIRWEKSRAIRAVSKLAKGVPIWTNAPDAMFLHADRVDSLIPARYTRDISRVLDGYPQAIIELRERVARDGGAIVYWRGVNRRGAPSVEDLDRDLNVAGLVRLEYRGDAVIWAHPATAKKLARWVQPTSRSAGEAPTSQD